MTSKTKNIIIVMLAATLFIGFFVGLLVGMNVEPSNSVVGTYKTDYWNGKSSVLVLNEDGSCFYPTGATGTWSQQGNQISIDLGDNSTHTAELVDHGIILHEKFFEKLD